MNRYFVAPGALMVDPNGSFVAYDDHLFEVTKLIGQIDALRVELTEAAIKCGERNARMLERAQRAERQVINAARALGYVDDEG